RKIVLVRVTQTDRGAKLLTSPGKQTMPIAPRLCPHVLGRVGSSPKAGVMFT
ncbi:hypothetical protein BaRGS_00010488, partial [Batillaria attramentaria]